MAKCKGCGAEIEWVTTEKGKAMPLDAAPTLAGTWLVSMRANDEKIGRPGTKEELERRANEAMPVEARVMFTPHWATCPQAKAFKRKEPKT